MEQNPGYDDSMPSSYDTPAELDEFLLSLGLTLPLVTGFKSPTPPVATIGVENNVLHVLFPDALYLRLPLSV